MRQFYTSDSEPFMVDDEDSDIALQEPWYSGTYQHVIGDKSKLHIEIMKKHGLHKEGLFVDHIDRDPRNNQKANLRMVTPQQNTYNVSVRKTLSKSGLRGIAWDSRRNKWKVVITAGGVTKSKRCKTREEAIKLREDWEALRWCRSYEVSPSDILSYVNAGSREDNKSGVVGVCCTSPAKGRQFWQASIGDIIRKKFRTKEEAIMFRAQLELCYPHLASRRI